MYYIQYSMGFFWTKDRHKYKQASGPSSLTDEEKTQEARGLWYTFIFTFSFTLQFSARNIYRKYNKKKIMSWQHTEIHTNCIYDFKQIMILLIFQPQLPSPSEEKDVLGHCKRQGLGKLVLLQQIFIGRLLYARHCGIPNYTFSLTIKKRKASEE